MKQKIYILYFLIVITGCENSQEKNKLKSTSISVIADVTDKKRLWPLCSSILKLYRCDENPDAEYRYNLNIISDKIHNPSYSYQLGYAKSLEPYNTDDDPQFRSKNIVAFYNAIRISLDSLYHKFDSTESLNHSECWSTINAELQKLSNDKSDKKYLIIHSDLMEKSDVFNSYRNNLNANANIIAQRFLNIYSLPESLHNITAIFIYEPATRDDDKNFNAMLTIYKILLEKRGVKVITKASNNYD